MKISDEKKFIIKLIFSEKKISDFEIKSLNLEKVIKITTAELILPLFYNKILTRGISKKFPDDFIKYCEEIFELNKSRNKILLSEAHSIKKIFKKNKIDFVFLKGTALLINKIYDDNTERMIGDIDLLIYKNQARKVEKILENEQYKKLYDYAFFEYRHLPRRVNNKKVFAVEPHIFLVDKKNLLYNELFLETENKSENNYTPNTINLLFHNIYSYQINDLGNILFSYSLRSIYDTVSILKASKIKIDDSLVKNDIIWKYFFFIRELKIMDKNDINISKKPIYTFIIKFLYYSPYILINYQKIIMLSARLKKVYLKIKMLIKNKKYRYYVYKKLSLL